MLTDHALRVILSVAGVHLPSQRTGGHLFAMVHVVEYFPGAHLAVLAEVAVLDALRIRVLDVRLSVDDLRTGDPNQRERTSVAHLVAHRPKNPPHRRARATIRRDSHDDDGVSVLGELKDAILHELGQVLLDLGLVAHGYLRHAVYVREMRVLRIVGVEEVV